MRQNYFYYNGKRYYTGQMLIMNDMGKHKRATFLYYDTTYDSYVYQIKECKHYDPKSFFYKNLIEVLNEKDANVCHVKSTPIKTNICGVPQIESPNDKEDFGLALGWMWYIFLMALATFFNDNVALWAIISIVFFSWKAKR